MLAAGTQEVIYLFIYLSSVKGGTSRPAAIFTQLSFRCEVNAERFLSDASCTANIHKLSAKLLARCLANDFSSLCYDVNTASG